MELRKDLGRILLGISLSLYASQTLAQEDPKMVEYLSNKAPTGICAAIKEFGEEGTIMFEYKIGTDSQKTIGYVNPQLFKEETNGKLYFRSHISKRKTSLVACLKKEFIDEIPQVEAKKFESEASANTFGFSLLKVMIAIPHLSEITRREKDNTIQGFYEVEVSFKPCQGSEVEDGYKVNCSGRSTSSVKKFEVKN